MTKIARDHLRRLEIQHFGCIENCTLTLTPLHALIGPNDSGKSTILGLLHELADHTGKVDCSTWRSRAEQKTRVTVDDTHSRVEVFGARTRSVLGGKAWVDEDGFSGSPDMVCDDDVGLTSPGSVVFTLKKRLAGKGTRLLPSLQGGAYLVRLDPDEMRKPAFLIENSAPLSTWNARGQGLAALYDAMFTRDFERILKLNQEFAKLFPSVKQLALENLNNQKRLGVVLRDGTSIPADQMSEGMLYWLAFRALEFLEPAGLILVEEPENGLHPARISEVIRILRDLSTRSQVILATHSPLVVNELEGKEVTVLIRTPTTGTRATRLSDTPNFLKRKKVFRNGELWLTYGDGKTESALLDPKVVD